VLSGAVSRSFPDDNGIRYTFGFVDDLIFSHNMPYGVWHWQYLRERRAVTSSHKFPTYSPGRATLFDFVVVYNGSKLHIGVLAMTTWERALQLVGGLQRAV